MNTIFKINLTIIIYLVLISTSVSATPGTCSSHQGVNCYAGSDWDGSAICNDGWRDSSETFYSVEMCADIKYVCNSEELRTLEIKYGYDDAYANFSDRAGAVEGQGRGIWTGAVTGQQGLINRQKALDLTSIQTKINTECYQLGYERYLSEMRESMQKTSDNLRRLNNYIEGRSAPAVAASNKPSTSCPENSSLVNGVCSCNRNTTFNGSACTPNPVQKQNTLTTVPSIQKANEVQKAPSQKGKVNPDGTINFDALDLNTNTDLQDRPATDPIGKLIEWVWSFKFW